MKRPVILFFVMAIALSFLACDSQIKKDDIGKEEVKTEKPSDADLIGDK